jgi:ATP/maltotriose-dependent transcriptional regulator MalT
MSVLIGGHARFMSRFDADALAQTREGIDQLEAQGIRLHMSYNWSLLASGLALAGEYDRAEAAAQHVLSRLVESDRQGETEALRVLALVAGARDGQLAHAEEFIQRAVAEAKRKQSKRDLALCDLTRSRILRRHGEHARAALLLGRAHARAAQIRLTLPHDLPAEKAYAADEVR